LRRLRRGRAKGLVGVVLGQFPSTSETFILREMLQLGKLGFQLLPLSLQRPEEGAAHAEAVELGSRTLYRSRLFSGRGLGRQLLAMFRYPSGYASSLLYVIRQGLRTPSAGRELLAALAAAADFAVQLPRSGRLAHVHAQFCSMPATVGLLLAEMLSITFSMSCHARDIFTGETRLLDLKLSEAEFAAVCTEHGRDRLRRAHPLTTGEKLHLIHHGLDLSAFMPPLERPGSPRVVLSVGRLVAKKGFDILLRAAALAKAKEADFELHIVGDGPERDDLERLAGGLGLRDNVVFHGRLTLQQIMPLYEAAHAFALASVVTQDGDRDGIPNVLIEALAMGVPTVATATGGIPEIIVDGETGLLAQPGSPSDLAEKLERILYDEELRERVRRAGRHQVAVEFDIARNIERLAALLGRYVEAGEQ